MNSFYETPRVEVLRFSPAELIANEHDAIISAPNAGIVPPKDP